MSITADRKQELIREYATKTDDTGSPEVQVAILSERIKNLTEQRIFIPGAVCSSWSGNGAACSIT